MSRTACCNRCLNSRQDPTLVSHVRDSANFRNLVIAPMPFILRVIPARSRSWATQIDGILRSLHP